MSETVEVKVPDLGDFKDIPVIEVLVRPGDAIKAEDPLLTLESEKATMEVPAPAAGVVKEVKVKVGDKVSEGSVVLLLDSDTAPASARAASAPAATKPAEPPPPATAAASVSEASPVTPASGERHLATLPPVDESAFEAAHASPAVRRVARELGVGVSVVQRLKAEAV